MIARKENLKEKNYRENGTENDKIGSKDSHKNMEINLCSIGNFKNSLVENQHFFLEVAIIY